MFSSNRIRNVIYVYNLLCVQIIIVYFLKKISLIYFRFLNQRLVAYTPRVIKDLKQENKNI